MFEIPILLAVLALVAVVGHGIWLVAAAVFRTISGQPSSAELRPRCPRCHVFLTEPARCVACDWDAVRDRPVDAKLVTRRQLDQLLRQGHLRAEVHRAVVRALQAAKQGEKVAAPPKPVAPVPPSVKKPPIPGLIHLAWPFVVWFTERIFREDKDIVEHELSAALSGAYHF